MDLVNNYRIVAIKSQLFASFYVRHCLQNNIELPPILFNQAFFYACIQKILQKPISNTNINLPRGHIDQVFQIFNFEFLHDCFANLPTGQHVYANSLAALATSSASNFTNHITETYSKRLKAFIKIRINEIFVSINYARTKIFGKFLIHSSMSRILVDALLNYVFNHSVNSTTGIEWPRQIIADTAENSQLANTIIETCRIDEAPVTLQNIASRPEVFLRRMYDFLLHFEAFNDDQVRTFSEVQVECTYAWVKRVIKRTNLFQEGLNRKRENRLAFLVFRNLRDSIAFQNILWLNAEQNDFIAHLIQQTMHQIENSRLYLGENSANAINIEACFRPEMSTSIKQYKLFSLVPSYSFTRKYVDIDYPHLISLLKKVGRELRVDSLIDEGDSDNKHERATYLFSQIFDFEKIRLDIN